MLTIYTGGSFKSNLVRYYHTGILYKKNHYGVDNITVVVKKMDLVEWCKKSFKS